MDISVFFAVLLIIVGTGHTRDIKYVPHTDIPPIRSKLGGVYNAYQWYQPSLSVVDACVPFPAVGDHIASRGLKLGGARNGKCSRNTGQVYVRHMNFASRKVRGIMYAYYFPKDQTAAGCSSPRICGHRHDWEEVVVWVTWDWKRPLGASYSQHGNYGASNRHWDGSHYKIQYISGSSRFNAPGKEFQSGHAFSHGSYNHPRANWYQLSSGVRFTLNNAVWLDQRGKQKATPKIIDTNKIFETKMNEAFTAFDKRGLF
ncbi:unnamed protein product [Agarophyton chilense]